MLVDAIADPWTPEEVEVRASWVHVAPLSRSDFPAETLAALARGRRVSFDGQGLVRPARTGLLEPDGAYDPEVLRFVSILKIADDEAAMLVDGYDERALGAARRARDRGHPRLARLHRLPRWGRRARPLAARRGPRPDRRG